MTLDSIYSSLVILILSIIGFLCVSCATQQAYRLELKETDAFTIPHEFIADVPTTLPDMLILGQDTSLYFYDRKKRGFHFFDLNQGEYLHLFTLESLPRRSMMWSSGMVLYKVVNYDSVIIALASTYQGYDHDSIIWVLDSSSRVKQVNSMVHPRLGGPWLENPVHDSLLFPFYLSDLRLVTHSNGVVFPTSCLGAFFGERKFHEQFIPVGGIQYLHEDRFITHKTVTYPDLQVYGNKRWPDEYGYSIVNLTHDGQVMYSFSYNETAYLLDLPTGNIKEVTLKAPFSYELTPFPEAKTRGSTRKVPDPFFARTFYDPYQRNYIRFNSHGRYKDGDKKWLYALYDTNFEFIGAGLLPKDLEYGACTPTPNGIGFISTEKYAETGELIFKMFQYKPVDSWKNAPVPWEDQAKGVKKEGAGAYIFSLLMKQNRQPISEGRVLLIPIDNSCPACLNYTYNWLSKHVNSGDLSERDYFIFAHESKAQLYEAVGDSLKQLIEQNNDQLLIDPGNTYKSFINNSFNPRFFKFTQDTTLQDIELDPGSIDMLSELFD